MEVGQIKRLRKNGTDLFASREIRAELNGRVKKEEVIYLFHEPLPFSARQRLRGMESTMVVLCKT